MTSLPIYFRLYIYGGHDIREGSINNLWMLDFNDIDDLDCQIEDRLYCCKWKLQAVKGNNPGRISHHSSVVYKYKMYLFGGNLIKEKETEESVVWELDL